MKKIGLLLILGAMLFSASCGSSTAEYAQEIAIVVENQDSAALAQLITHSSEEGTSESVMPIVEENFTTLSSGTDYEDFQFMRTVINDLGDTEEANTLENVLDSQFQNEVKAFLSGDWVRKDATHLDGCIITVTFSDTASFATIKDLSQVVDDSYKFSAGDVKWDNIQIVDRNTIKFDTLTMGDESKYITCLGTIDYDAGTIKTHASDPTWLTYYNGDNLWMRKDIFDANSEKSVLTEEDFVMLESNSDNKTDVFEELSDTEFTCFFTGFDPSLDKSEDAWNVTSRDIGLDATREDVISAYGIGSESEVLPDVDAMAILIHILSQNPSLPDILKYCDDSLHHEVKYFIQYSNEAHDHYIRFYFDEQDLVKLIIWYNDEPGKHVYEEYVDSELQWKADTEISQ